MNKTGVLFTSIMAIMNLISALLIFTSGGNIIIAYFNLLVASVLATFVYLEI